MTVPWLALSIILVGFALVKGCPQQCQCDETNQDDLNVYCRTSDEELANLTSMLPTNTTHLYLNGSGISIFPELVLTMLPMLKLLDLQSNLIRYIPHVKTRDKVINLSGNPVFCDCGSRQLSNANTVKGTCIEPSHVIGTSIADASVPCVQCLALVTPLRDAAKPFFYYNAFCPLYQSCVGITVSTSVPLYSDPMQYLKYYRYGGMGCFDLGLIRDSQCDCKNYLLLETVFDDDRIHKLVDCDAVCCNSEDMYCNALEIVGIAPQATKEPCTHNYLNCSQICYNSSNVIHCECDTGYQLMQDQRTCADINECSSQILNNCSQLCVNINGGYHCSCREGYVLLNDSKTCEDVNECSNSLLNNCSQLCMNTEGSYKCSCYLGYKLLNDNISCADIDECSGLYPHKICSQLCVNTKGSYHCDCKSGYRLSSDGQTCLDINECTSPQLNNCSMLCVNTEGSGSGSGQSSMEMIESFNLDPVNCSQCINEKGSFRCICAPGFLLTDDGQTCSDINECQFSQLNNCSLLCANSEGSASGSGQYCADVNECFNQEPVSCSRCINDRGSFHCTCSPGFSLSDDGQSCEDIDECLLNELHNCSQDCVNSAGSYHCRCRSGYVISSDGRTCEDINDCSSSQDNNCSQLCVISNGSYHCSCRAGYVLMNDSITCEDVNECLTTQPCSQLCANSVGSYFCSCKTGYGLSNDSKTCEDINECSNPGLSNCSQLCTNSVGSYHCSCRAGYVLSNDGKICEDVNECSSAKLNNCGQLCVNIDGSYNCTCQSGYQLSEDGKTCEDINECSSPLMHKCDYTCFNYIGGHVCGAKVIYSRTPVITYGVNISSTSIFIQWTKVLGVRGYEVAYIPFMMDEILRIVKTKEISLIVTGLHALKVYKLFVRSISFGGIASPWSKCFIVSTDEYRLRVSPMNVTVAEIGHTHVLLVSWTGLESMEHIHGLGLGYRVVFMKTHVATSKPVTITTTNTSVFINAVEPGGNYSVKVCVFTRKGDGPYSKPVFITVSKEHPCDHIKCLNNGICEGYSCRCLDRYFGQYCQHYTIDSLHNKTCTSPLVKLLNISHSLATATVFSKAQAIVLSVLVSVNCSFPAEATVWSVHSLENDKIIYESNSSQSLIIPGRYLHYGRYKVKATVVIQGHPISGVGIGYINIKPSSLRAIIKVASNLKGGDNITLDASDSFDPDTGSSDGFSFSWICTTTGDCVTDETLESPTVELPWLLSSSVPMPFYSKGGCYDTGVGFLPTTGPVLVLYVTYMKPGARYITVVIEKGKKHSFLKKEITISHETTTQLSIRCLKNCRSPVNHMAKIALTPFCSGLCEENMQYQWSAYYGSHGDTWQNISGIEKHFETSITSLVIEPFALEPGRTVRVDLRAHKPTAKSMKASYTFTMDTPPRGGRCLVTPKKGVALKTMFRFYCYNWTDNHMPIKYAFSYVTSDGINSVIQKGFLPSTLVSLSPGNKNVTIDVIDAYGAYTSVYLFVKVNSEVSENEKVKEASNLILGKSSRLRNLIRNNDIKQAYLLSRNVLQLLNGRRNKTNVEEAIKIKSEIIKQVTSIDAQTVDDIRDKSSIIAQATADINEVSQTAQENSAQALAKMATVLKRESSKNKTKDPRSLLSGASSLLSGITNSLIISSTNAKYHKVEIKTHTKSFLRFNKNLSLVLIDATKTIGKAVLTNIVVGERPTTLESPTGLALLVSRQTPSVLSGSVLEHKGAQFTFPNNPTIFGNTTAVDSQILVSSFNMFSWHQTSERPTSIVASLETTDSKGHPITMKNLSDDITIQLPQRIKTVPGIREFSLEFGRTIYHKVQVNYSDVAVNIDIQPTNNKTTLLIATSYGARPTNDTDYKMVLPVRGSRNLYRVRVASRVGFHFIGIRSRINNLNYTAMIKYTMRVAASACLYWSENLMKWVSDGCKVGGQWTAGLTVCKCNHLTSFASQFYVAPNPIDFGVVFVKFTEIPESGNIVAFVALGCIFFVYLVGVSWARRQDKNDKIKVGVSPFLGSLSSNAYQYQVAITTGVWRNSGTTARVYIVLQGSESSHPVLLHNPSCVPFSRGNTDVFVLSFQENLGKINKIRIWHDNSGSNPSWYLSHVVIKSRDHHQPSTFIFQQWLAVEKGAGLVDRTKTASTKEELNSIKTSFNGRLSEGLANEHLWCSVFAKTPNSVFTRVQRVTCCWSIALSMMLVSAMFYELAPQQSPNSDPSLKIGPLRLKLRQMLVAVQSTLIVAPLHIIIVFIFEHIRPSTTPAKFDTRYSITRPVTFPKDTTKTCTLRLPSCFICVAYFLCFVSITISSLFIIFYSLQWGQDVTTQWLISIIMSLSLDICVGEPMTLLLLVLLGVLVCRRGAPSLVLKKSFKRSGVVMSMDDVKPSKGIQEAHLDQDDNEEVYKEPEPPNKEELRNAARLEKMNKSLQHWFFELVFFVFYLWTLMTVAYAGRDYYMYSSTSTISNALKESPELEFKDISSFWKWTSDFLLPSLYGDFDGDYVHVGMPIITQKRIKRGECNVNPFRKATNCTVAYNPSVEESQSFRPRWLQPWKNVSSFNATTKPEGAWMYSSIGGPTWSYLDSYRVYSSGGYSLIMEKSLNRTQSIIKSLKSQGWVDRHTSALFVVFVLFNSQTMLFSRVKIVIEKSSIGTLERTGTQIETIRVYDIGAGYDVVLLIVQLLFPLLVLYYLIKQILSMRNGLVKYLSTVFNWVENIQIIFAIAWIVVNVFKLLRVDIICKQLKKNIQQQDNEFEFVVQLHYISKVLLAFLIFFNTMKLLMRVRFGPIEHFFGVLGTALRDVISYSVMLVIGLFAFVHFGVLVFGRDLHAFRNIVECLVTLFSVMIGNQFDFYSIQSNNRVLGPFYHLIYGLSSMFVFVNIFILILIHYIDFQANRNRHLYGLGRFIIDRLKEACGRGKTVPPREPTEMEELKRQCRYAMSWFQTKTCKRLENLLTLTKLRNSSPSKFHRQKQKYQRMQLCGLLSFQDKDKPSHPNLLCSEYTLQEVIERKLKKLNSLVNNDYVSEFGEDLDSSRIYSAVCSNTLKPKLPQSIPEVFFYYHAPKVAEDIDVLRVNSAVGTQSLEPNVFRSIPELFNRHDA